MVIKKYPSHRTGGKDLRFEIYREFKACNGMPAFCKCDKSSNFAIAKDTTRSGEVKNNEGRLFAIKFGMQKCLSDE